MRLSSLVTSDEQLSHMITYNTSKFIDGFNHVFFNQLMRQALRKEVLF